MKHIIFVALLLATVTLAAQCPEPESKELRFNLNDSLIEQEMTALSHQMTVPLHYNGQVREFISLYVNLRHEQTDAMLQRSYTYFPVIEAVLRQHGLPDELKYLAMVESALNPKAVSRDGKQGLWQLSPAIAGKYGLVMGDDVNQCFNLEQSTEVACSQLKRLYAYYGDWLLAMIAFGTSVGTVDKAIAATGGISDYWAIWKHLPKEVRGYVPAYMALVYIMNQPETYDIHPMCPVIRN